VRCDIGAYEAPVFPKVYLPMLNADWPPVQNNEEQKVNSISTFVY